MRCLGENTSRGVRHFGGGHRPRGRTEPRWQYHVLLCGFEVGQLQDHELSLIGD